MTARPQADIVADIKAFHRRRRYAMKLQQKVDRALESFVRREATAWTFDADEKEREKFNKEVKAIIAAARKGEGMQVIVEYVQMTDKGREPFDAARKVAEAHMEKLAASLPVAAWIATVRGAGNPGLATIIAETGDLSNYANPAKVWKRLGFAPYDGLAGSTWKRPTWRTRTLTAEEWTREPFSGERYALIHQCAVWLKNTQWIGAAKTGTGEGKPNGHYGEIYAKRRAHTAVTHPDWTKQHAHMDALRVMMKAFLKDLWIEWRKPAPVEPVKPEPSETKPKRRARVREKV